MQKPFAFETDKRMRLAAAQDAEAVNDENNVNGDDQVMKSDGKKSQKKPYEPLCLQVERNFRLRASDEKPKGDDGKPRKLTRPKSPNLQVAVR